MASIRDKWVPRERYDSARNLADHYKDMMFQREWLIMTVLDAHESEIGELFDYVQEWVMKKEGFEDAVF